MRPNTTPQRFFRHSGQRGQAMVETVIVLPVFLFFILGLIQLTMMHQARLMLEYAAFNAARAGSVWNADPAKMRHAAMVSMIATRPAWPIIGSIGTFQTQTEFLGALAKLTLAENLSSIGGSGLLKMVKVDTLSPTQADFESGQEELDFDIAGDDFSARRLGQLTIRVTYFYNLAIPFANWVIWNTWYEIRSKGMSQINQINGTLGSFGLGGIHVGNKPFLAFDAIRYDSGGKILAELFSGGGMHTSPYECLTTEDWLAMVALPELVGDQYGFYIPLVTAHTIRMQSNHYRDNLPTKAEATCSGS